MVNGIPAKRVLRLRAEGLSGRAIAKSQGVARKSVAAVIEAADRPQGVPKFIKKYAAYTVLVLDEWLLERPDESTRTMAAGADGTPSGHWLHGVLHPVRHEELACPPGWSRSRRRDHGTHRPQRPLDHHRPHQHEATDSPHKPDHPLIRPNPPAGSVVPSQQDHHWPHAHHSRSPRT